MCRWIIYISPGEPTLLSDVLVTPPNAITKQCSEHYLPFLLPHGKESTPGPDSDVVVRMRNHLLNIDGIGVAWYTPASSAYTKDREGPRPAVYKSQSPPMNDFNFRSICKNTESRCVLSHIRAASPGGGAVTAVNNHPFVFGRHAVMHNGTVDGFLRIRDRMVEMMSHNACDAIIGTTDSEYVAALYVSNLAGGVDRAFQAAWDRPHSTGAMKRALKETVLTILQLQKETFAEEMGASNLNLCVSDGTKAVACRFLNHKSNHMQPPSLYWTQTGGRTLFRKHLDANGSCYAGGDAHRRYTIIASEPSTFPSPHGIQPWTLIEKNKIVIVNDVGDMEFDDFEYPASLNGTFRKGS